MKKYKIIGLTFWTIANALLPLRLWDYLPITPLFTVQIIISICCSILFCVDFSSKTMRIIENIIVIFLIFLALCYIIHCRQPVSLITLISSVSPSFGASYLSLCKSSGVFSKCFFNSAIAVIVSK